MFSGLVEDNKVENARKILPDKNIMVLGASDTFDTNML